MSLLRRVWRATSHPHVAQLYANAQPGASAVDRLKRIRELIDIAAAQPAGRHRSRARLRSMPIDWVAARNALANYSVAEPTQAVCLLMAEIEEGQNADQGKAREWLARAVRAPRRSGLDRRWHHRRRMGADLADHRAARCVRVARAACERPEPRRAAAAAARQPAAARRRKLRLRPIRPLSKRPALAGPFRPLAPH